MEAPVERLLRLEAPVERLLRLEAPVEWLLWLEWARGQVEITSTYIASTLDDDLHSKHIRAAFC